MGFGIGTTTLANSDFLAAGEGDALDFVDPIEDDRADRKEEQNGQ